ncbi:RTA1 like protein-domain-containing protein [Emericellopsis atlantica]|uniref:RTA1 like protein-domain-containing protein n=1 Tax=Emericellopsis atlantica TaxID=2614577 RepID=A0A9P7ZME1_9HYPO|nr:RTA1 like protein-domain-containing protein [Emericellopsis atlantica]KAG9254346.1 RTA1 like protein-domain-containing protein [Emericellopsis atlantica]
MAVDSTSTESDSEGFKLYHYDPSLAAAIIFTLFFAIASIRHFQILFRKKTWFFIPFLVGCCLECIGYGMRAWSAKQTPDWTLMPYILQNLLILLGPTLFAASIYMLLGRIIRHLDAEQFSVISPRWLTKIFLLGDVISIFGQGGGGGLMAASDSESTSNLGNTIILLGLGVQVTFFSGFMIVMATFHRRIASLPTTKARGTLTRWKTVIWVTYIVSLLILVRSVFRMIEYAQGNNGSLLQKEIYIYLLDTALMFIVAATMAYFHPGLLLAEERALDDDVILDQRQTLTSHPYSRMA